MVLSLQHFTTCIDEGIVARMQGGQGISCKVSDPIMELVITIHDEVALLYIQCVAYG